MEILGNFAQNGLQTARRWRLAPDRSGRLRQPACDEKPGSEGRAAQRSRTADRAYLERMLIRVNEIT